MNKTYNLVWSAVRGAFIATHECAKSKGKPSSTRTGLGATGLVLGLMGALGGLGGAGLAFAAPPTPAMPAANALPTGAQVAAGSASIAQTANRMDVTQTSQKAIVNWQTFNIGSAAHVNFAQPNGSAVALNRVLSSDPSAIYGKLTANGQVFLVNQAGVLFGAGARVDVGGLVASTMDVSDADFTNGRYAFGSGLRSIHGGSVLNQGSITAAQGGYVALLAPEVRNEGLISASMGTVLLAGVDAVTLSHDSTGLHYAVDKGAVQALVDNKGLVQAEGGQVILSARAANSLASAVINNSGTIEAKGLSSVGGRIVLEGGRVFQNGMLAAAASVNLNAEHMVFNTGTVKAGERIDVATQDFIDSGALDVSHTNAAGGQINIQASGTAEVASAGQILANGLSGGSINLAAGTSAYLSGQFSASASNGDGGSIAITAPALTLAGTQLHADGAQTGHGGSVKIGGGWQGSDASIANANTTQVGFTSTTSANAGQVGRGGTVVLWSEQRTDFAGDIQAKGGTLSGDGGQVEVSSHNTLAFAGLVTASATNGANGQLLLDPKNINIEATVAPAGFTKINLPAPGTDSDISWGRFVVELSNGNIAVRGQGASEANGTGIGVVRLFNGSTGALISTITGTNARDQMGSGGLFALSNGNVMVMSPYYGASDFSGFVGMGAITWLDGATGKFNNGNVGGQVDTLNSLRGVNDGQTNTGAPTYLPWIHGDHLGSGGALELSNGNVLVGSPSYSSSQYNSSSGKGAITWVDGSTGKFKDIANNTTVNGGAISANNSLMGSVSGAQWGYNMAGGGTTILAGGNVLVSADTLSPGRAWIAADGSTAAGSLGSGAPHVFSGTYKLTKLTDGNFVLGSASGNSNQGYAVWVNGLTGLTTGGVDKLNASDTLTNANALIGDATYTGVGSAVTALDGGRYLVSSNKSVTWVDASAGNGTGTNVTGTVGSGNSFTGYTAAPTVDKLSNGNYVLTAPFETFGGVTAAGVATWFDGSTGYAKGESSRGAAISASNSLYGTTTNDNIGNYSTIALSNGNYVVKSALWDNAGATDAGAATWGSGTTGVAGAVSASNSLVGSTANDKVGYNLTALPNGNYVVGSYAWNGNKGAATWGNGNTGVVGVVSSANSLVGSTAFDYVGNVVTALSNGNYLVQSNGWDNGGTANVGAVTWGNGATGITGAVSGTNSLVGSTALDQVGFAVTALSNGNYVVRSHLWDNGATADVGAVTWGNGATGITGVVSSTNSLVGAAANTQVGVNGVHALPNGNYVVLSPYALGSAATWGDGSAGITGTISNSNSFHNAGGLGTTIDVLADGNYVIRSANASYGSYSGLVTWFNASNGFALGETSADASFSLTNSFYGSVQYYSSDLLTPLRVGANVGALITGRWGATNQGMVDMYLPTGGGTTLSGNVLYGTTPGTDNTFTAAQIKALLDAGTNLSLQANNDITINSAITVNNSGGNGGHLTLQAGRYITFNANVTTDNGNLTAIAGDSGANATYKEAGTPTLTIASGKSIDVGTGTATLVARGGVFANNAGASGITTSGSGRYLVYAADPSTSTEGMTGYSKHYAQSYTGSEPSYAGSGNWMLYSTAPVLSVTPGAASMTYGDANPSFTGTSSGYIDGDLVGTSGISGSATYTVGGTTSTGGRYTYGNHDVAYSNGLLSSLGYTFADAAGSTNELSVSKRDLTLSGLSVAGKTYDGTNTASISGTPSVAPLSSDLVTLNGAVTGGTFASPRAGTHAVTVTGLSGITGADAGNYNFISSFSANIGQRTLTPTISNTGVTKAYDGTTSTNLTPSYTFENALAGDTFTLSNSGSIYNAKTVAGASIVTVSGLVISSIGSTTYSSLASDYVLDSSSKTVSAAITRANLTLAPVTGIKVYDSLITSGATVTVTGKAASDTVTAAQEYQSANVLGANASTLQIKSGYTIVDGSAADMSANYTITASGTAAGTVSARPVTVTAATQTKVYGNADPALTYTTNVQSGGVGLVTGETLSGSLTRAVGEPVASYAISQGTLTNGNNSNYAISYTGANLTISQRPITLLATSASKIYGEADPTLAVSISNGSLGSVTVSDSLTDVTGTLSRSAGSNVGSYNILLGSGGTVGSKASNYAITYTSANSAFSITQRPIEITADAQSKVYGNADPSLTYAMETAGTGSGRVGTDTFTGSLSRSAGETVAGGPYAIAQGTVANSNYAITFAPANLSITQRPITLTASAATKVYGENDPSLAVTANASGAGVGLATTGNSNTVNDSLADVTGTLSREAGTVVGSYDIALGTGGTAGSKAGNYAITFTTDNNAVSVTRRPVTVTADAKTKTYGDTDPALTFATNSGTVGTGVGLLSGDNLSGSLTRVAGDTSGAGGVTYQIQQGTVDNGNYDITYVPANLTIGQRSITLLATSATKVYGEADPTFAATVSAGSLANNSGISVVDSIADVAGTLGREAGSDVGVYDIYLGTGATVGSKAGNYAITFVTNNNAFAVTQRPIEITAEAQSKIYGNADPVFTYVKEANSSGRGLVGSDTFTGNPTRVAGEDVASYAINSVGTLANSNYAITVVPANLTVSQRPITLTASAATKVYGEVDPALAVTVTSGSLATVAQSDALSTVSGTLSRQTGENVGAYDIALGTGSKAANYAITFTTDNNAVSVTRRPVTVTADAKSKTYGDADPALTYTNTTGTTGTGTGLWGSDTLSGSLTRAAGETSGAGGVTYQIQQGTVTNTANGNYDISYTPADLSIGQRPITLLATSATKVYGEADPTFAATVSAGGLANNSGISVVDSIADVAGTLGRSAGSTVASYNILLGTGSNAGNYAITYNSANSAFSITQRPINITADAQSKVYGNADPVFSYVKEANSSGRGLVGSDTFAGNPTRVAGETVAGYAINNVGTLANANYAITVVPANLTVTQRPITLTATAATKVYGENDPALAVTVTGGNGLATVTQSDSLADVSGTLSRQTGENVGAYDIALGSGSKAGNYAITFTTDNNAVSVTRRPVTVTADAKSKTYGDTDPALTFATNSGTAGTGVGLLSTDSISGALTRAAGETSGAGGVTYAIQQGGVTNTANGNYDISYTPANLTINQKTLTLSGSTGVSKTYSGTTAMSAGTNGYGSLVGLVGSDVVTVSGAPVFSAANQGARTINVGSVAIAGADAGNYTLSWSNGSGTINAAPLTITANNDANFVTLASTGAAAYNGVSYSGFVNGEGTGVLGLGSLAITRSGSGPDGNTGGAATLAGTYTNALTPSGATANNGNYSITFAPGTYTIVPADRLLVTVSNAAFTYGTAPSYTIASAKYLDGSNNIQTLAAPTASGNTYTYSDGSGGTAVFTLGPVSAQTSTNGALKAGSYSIGASNITESSGNFSNNLVVVGALTVNQKGLTATATGVSKTYDGSTSMNGVTLGLTGLETNDIVTVGGNGAFAQKNVGTSLAYSVSSVSLGSTDSANYYLSGGSTLSGSNGAITQKAVTLAAARTYDGTTTLANGTVTITTGISGETLTYSAATANTKNVGTGGYVNAITLGNETGATTASGGLASNYSLPSLTAASAGNAVTFSRKALTVTGTTAANKTYDGTTSAVLSLGALQGLVAGEALTLTGVGTFDNANVGVGKTVGIQLAVANGIGGLEGNYSISDATTTANINAVPFVPTPQPDGPTQPKPPPPDVPEPPPPLTPPDTGTSSGSSSGGTDTGSSSGSSSSGGSTSSGSSSGGIDTGSSSGSGSSSGGTYTGSSSGSSSGGTDTGTSSSSSSSGGSTSSGSSSGGTDTGTTSGSGSSSGGSSSSGSSSGGADTGSSSGSSSSGGSTSSGSSSGGTDTGTSSGSSSSGGSTSSGSSSGGTDTGSSSGSGSSSGGTDTGSSSGSSSSGGSTSSGSSSGGTDTGTGSSSGSSSGGSTSSGSSSGGIDTGSSSGSGSSSGGSTSSGSSSGGTDTGSSSGSSSSSGGSTSSGSGSSSGGDTSSSSGSSSGGGTPDAPSSPNSPSPVQFALLSTGESAAAEKSSSSSNTTSGGSGAEGFISVKNFGTLVMPAGSLFSFTLPKDTFKHADPKTSVVLEARGENGPLPDWLKFEPGTGKFAGRPPESLASFTVIVTARDSSGNEVSIRVVLNFTGKGKK